MYSPTETALVELQWIKYQGSLVVPASHPAIPCGPNSDWGCGTGRGILHEGSCRKPRHAVIRSFLLLPSNSLSWSMIFLALALYFFIPFYLPVASFPLCCLLSTCSPKSSASLHGQECWWPASGQHNFHHVMTNINSQSWPWPSEICDLTPVHTKLPWVFPFGGCKLARSQTGNLRGSL